MLNYRETRIAKGMLRRGDRQHDIAAYFGVNAGRIAEIASGNSAYAGAEPAEPSTLPPPGPYLSKFALQSVIRTLNEAIDAIEMAEHEENLDDVKAALVLAKDSLQAKIDELDLVGR
jgi:hypothetical protein